MALEDVIDDGLLSDAREVDSFLREHGEDLPSVENTLRLVRDISTDRLRTVAEDVWGTGGEEGNDLIGTKFDACVAKLDEAIRESSAWTGDGKNAYALRIEKTKKALDSMRKPSADVGQALEEIADAWDQVFGRSVADILALIGLALSIIGVVVALIVEISAGWTGVGAVVGLVIGILSILVGAVSIWWTIHSNNQAKIDALQAAGTEAQETMTSADKAAP